MVWLWFLPVSLAAALTAAWPAAAAERVDGTLVVTAEDCRNVTGYVPAPGVEYQPGVDVRGRPVAPADLNDAAHGAAHSAANGATGEVPPPDSISFEITLNLREFFNDPSGTGIGRYLDEVTVGQVTARDGMVYLDGRPLGDALSHAIAEECRRRLQAPR